MESSEDDAGTATSASRRASAREKDVGLAEDVDATRNFQHESSEARTSCGTPAMSEDNFDGDSIPSPSTKDTSTEAILDMIDDFIDGPGAPRRLPLVSEVTVDIACGRVTTPTAKSASVSHDSQHNNEPEKQKEQIEMLFCGPSLAVGANSENISESVRLQPAEAECTPDSEILLCANTSTIEESPQASYSVQMDENSSIQQQEISKNVEPEVLTQQLVMAPPSSSVETVKVISDASECENLERTVKSVTSSENRDSVTVELAESTSSECSVSESKALSVEPSVSRSPLKRRLIRPAPSDRRPDSTVSSTVDSQTTDIHTMEQTGSEPITKDVSSSSDAVSNIHGNSKPEEISNVREISICKAETSTTSLRKIKLVRPKVTPVMTFTVKTGSPTKPATLEKDQCQSTSSDDISTPSSAEPSVETTSSVSTEKSGEQESKLEPIGDTSDEQQLAQISEPRQEVTINTCDALVTKTVEKKSYIGPSEISLEKNDELSQVSQTVSPSVNQCSATDKLSADTQLEVKYQSSERKNQDNILDEEKKVPPIKLSLSLTKSSETEINRNDLEAQCSKTKPEIPENSCHDDKNPSMQSVQTLPLEIQSTNCDQDSKQVEQENVSNCEIMKTDTKVPPITLILTNADHNTAKVPSITQSSKLLEVESISPKLGDSEKQVPKLTIKLTNKCTEEVKSPVPRLTIKPLRPPVEENIDGRDTNQQVPSVSKINIKVMPKPIEKESESLLKPIPSPAEQNIDEPTQQLPSVSKVNIKPIPKPTEKRSGSLFKSLPPPIEQNIDNHEANQPIPNVSKIHIKPILKPTEIEKESLSKSLRPSAGQNIDDNESIKQIPNVSKINIKPIPKPTEKDYDSISMPSRLASDLHTVDHVTSQVIPSVTKINIKPILKPTEKRNESVSKPLRPTAQQNIDDLDINQQIPSVTKINIKPIPKPTEKGAESISKPGRLAAEQNMDNDTLQQIPNITKINIKPIPKPVDKGTENVSKCMRPTAEQNTDGHDTNQQIPSVIKINIKPIPKPTQEANDSIQGYPDTHHNDLANRNEQIPNITKLNIKPILKPPEKVNEVHRKSSSSEISESEYSENDESTSTSDQASASEQRPLDAVPKVTIRLGKPGTESEGKFYTEKNVPKITIKNIPHSDKDDQDSKMKLIIRQSDDKQLEKIPKMTIKTVKADSQPLSPKLTIKPLKTPENVNKDNEIPKLKMSTEAFASSAEVKENLHVPKITIKPVTKTDADGTAKAPKKLMCDSSEHIPVVTKLNIKPILKPTESGESSESFNEKVPVVSKLNIKPLMKPKDNEVDSSIEDVPKIIKLNIKPLKNPGESSSEKKDCDDMNEDMKDSSIPVVTKLNIKPIVKPVEDEALKDSENQSSETGNSSDDNADHIPIVTKLNIKPIVKPSELEEPTKPVHSEQCIPIVTKLNIKPLIRPEDHSSPSSPKRESLRNIKPLVKPEDRASTSSPKRESLRNIKPLIKPEDSHSSPSSPKKESLRNIKPEDRSSPSSPKKDFLRSPGSSGIPVVTKLNIKPIVKPEDSNNKSQEENVEKSPKHPSLVMKINMKNVSDNITENEHLCNNVSGKSHSPKMSNSPKVIKQSMKVEGNVEVSSKQTKSHNFETTKNVDCNPDSPSLLQTDCPTNTENSCESNVVPEKVHKTIGNELHSSSKDQSNVQKNSLTGNISIDETLPKHAVQETIVKSEPFVENKTSKTIAMQMNERIAEHHYNTNYTKSQIQNCTLLKKLLSSTKEDFDKSQETKSGNCLSQSEKSDTLINCNDSRAHEGGESELQKRFSPKPGKTNDLRHTEFIKMKMRSIQDVHRDANESVTKPLEISITDKITNQGQDSPRIILKINKTDHGASSKIITEETHEPSDCSPSKDSHVSEQIVETGNEIPSPKKHLGNSRRKTAATDSPANLTMGKRLRSSRIVETPDKSAAVKRNVNKRPSAIDSPPQHKESELSILATKRMKLEQLLSVNQSLTITPVGSKTKQTSPSKSSIAFNQGGKVSHNISLLNSENCSQKNGNSKLHNILSNLQAKQMQTLQLNDASASEKTEEIKTEVESTTSTGSSDVVVEITRVENCHPEVQEMMINENSVCDLTEPEEVSQDPLEVESVKPEPPEEIKDTASIKTIELTPTPRKRGRPRKLPLADTPKPPPLPVPALEERPQRSLRLMRDRPAILKKKPRGGRGRGRGGRRAATPPPVPKPEPVVVIEMVETRAASPIDPTSSRIKLPRMTEALDKSVAGASCATPLTSRRRSSAADLKLFGSAGLVLDSPVKGDEFMKSPEVAKPKSGRGSRGGRGRTPRNRGRGRGGGRGAMYMKETMGIYGRVCGPATTTVQLFEEETCMMDDNATPSKPSHLLDEDSQSSVKSSTNDSNKMKKSKFADLFDSNKVWTAADVKEYTWPPPETPNTEPQVMMIQEQVAMFLGVKSFKRRYPELKRRPVSGEERDHVLGKEIVSEALCDLGITAVEASEVLDIMLSDYPHKYEEYRSHQREKQIASSLQKTVENKTEDRSKVEIKVEKAAEKPEPPKVDPVKARQELAAAAIASASEWNARANAWRRPACVDLQSMTVHRRRAPAAPPPLRVRPPAGFYPHALLPGQYQHGYRTYTSDQLRYFPLNTVLAAPPAPPSPAESSSESEGSWGENSSSSDDTDTPHHHSAKRKKLSRVKRSSQQDKEKEKEEKEEADVETCRVCKLRLEANRKHAHERFLVCAHCNAKLHPVCVELPADTIRKCREYAWQCAECKSCCACRQPQDDDKMLFCDRCDRGFHIYCVGLSAVPSGRWHCVECAICKSCGARDPNGLTPGAPGTPGPSTPGPSTPGASTGPAEWQHQTRRGPGGHKVYSHSLCMPCARAYRIGRYCPLCERSFIGPKGTMQLVICKLCDRQLHQECVRQTSAAALRVLDYTCAECRRGGITSRAAAVRVAPRTIATLFMAKRRFNKYAHRQYMASRLQALQDAEEPERADTDADDTSDPLDGAGDPPPLPDDSPPPPPPDDSPPD